VADADRRTKIKELENRITSEPVLCGLDEQSWLSHSGCRALRQAAELSRAITTEIPPGPVRSRLLSADAATFSQLLHSAARTLRPIIKTVQSDVQRLISVVGTQFVSGDKGVTEVVTRLELCLPAVQSISEWCEVARRRASLCANGLEPLLTAFEEAGLSPDRLSQTFNALNFHYRAVRARQARAPLRNMNSLDIENDRERFVVADESLKRRQREAIRAKLLGKEISLGSGVGHKREWTELHLLRNEFTKQASCTYPPTTGAGRTRRHRAEALFYDVTAVACEISSIYRNDF
jgi:hypothetical protein